MGNEMRVFCRFVARRDNSNRVTTTATASCCLIVFYCTCYKLHYEQHADGSHAAVIVCTDKMTVNMDAMRACDTQTNGQTDGRTDSRADSSCNSAVKCELCTCNT